VSRPARTRRPLPGCRLGHSLAALARAEPAAERLTGGRCAIARPAHITTRGFQGPYIVRFRLWWRTRRQGALLVAPFRLTGRGKGNALRCISIGPGTRIGQFAWFSVVSPKARLTIGPDCTIGPSFGVTFRGEVTIGAASGIGERCLISDHGHDHMTYLLPSLTEGVAPRFGFEVSEGAPVVIGSGVHIGVNVVISPGVHIGDGAVVGANSVVTRSVDPFTVVAGVPARVIRTISLDEQPSSEQAST
jgi:acetyltransferase-like isoleucine patch superfamily enzyme